MQKLREFLARCWDNLIGPVHACMKEGAGDVHVGNAFRVNSMHTKSPIENKVLCMGIPKW